MSVVKPGGAMRLLIYAYIDSVPFKRDVVARESSLGGSESACMGLMEALARRGHDVHVFATKLDPQATGEWRGVIWHPAETLLHTMSFAPADVFISLRMVDVFSLRLDAKMCILWAQDLLTQPALVGQLSQVDHVAYVSEFHRKQWEGLQPILQPMGWVTRNGIDPADLPSGRIPRGRHDFIYTSRPERGLRPLLAMWSRIREALPDATLRICRYKSMYDGEGTGVANMVAEADVVTERVAKEVGGITMLGQLNKAQLYEALSQSRLLLYPGVADFAETNGIAWTEAQACGTPIIASLKGAAPETVGPNSGVLVAGDADSPEYQEEFIRSVIRLSEDDMAWGRMSRAGREHALPRYDHDVIAAEWESQIVYWFKERYLSNKAAVMRQLLWWDHHAAARVVAHEIVADGASDIEEAKSTIALCDRVMAQQEQTKEDYANYAHQNVIEEAEMNGRLRQACDFIAALKPKRIMDVACGNGSMALLLSRANPDATIDAWDSSPGVLKLAQECIAKEGAAGRVSFHCGEWTDIRGVYDVVFCGEFIEHLERPWELVDRLSSHCTPNGTVVFTTPCGPFAELLPPGLPRLRGHTHAFSVRDLIHMCKEKRDFSLQYLPVGASPRGTAVGYWMVSFRPGGPAQPIDYADTILTTRPYQRVVASMIVKNGADYLRRCITSMAQMVDRIVIFDTGSIDGSQELARSLGAEVRDIAWPGDFSSARNAALSAVEGEAEWIFWIDSDEQLIDAHNVRKYLNGAGPFVGYVLQQTHLMLDQPTFHDRPVRIFKTGRGVKFYGLVHEQPEDKVDAGVFPALEISDSKILHLGYITDAVRRVKAVGRNMELLQREIQAENPRQLAIVHAIRDEVQLAQFARESAGGVMTQTARRHLLQAVVLYRSHFTDPAHRYHELAQPFYQAALDSLGEGWEVVWSFAASRGKVRGKVGSEKFRVLSLDEMRTEIDRRLEGWYRAASGPSIDCEPIVNHAHMKETTTP